MRKSAPVPASPRSLQGTARKSSTADMVAKHSSHFSLIVHSHLRWDFVWQRPQQLLSRLARRHAVLFIEDPLPQSEGLPSALETTEPYPGVVRVVPRLKAGVAEGADEEAELIKPLVEEALRSHPVLTGRFEHPVQWFYSPMTAPVFLNQFGVTGVVYDCMDELANFRFAPPDIAEREAALLAAADVVFTGGYQLFRAKSARHENVHFYGCGVDCEHYSKALLPDTEVAADVADLPRPVFGYFGVIDERLDYELIDHLAQSHPQGSVVMVGPTAKVDPATLPQTPNIHWLGQRAYADLPALVKGFDVCLMPFALNEATKFINPTKTLEYMAAGKPIVSTAVPDVVRNFTPIVHIARNSAEFARVAGASAARPEAFLVKQGIARAAEASWESMVDAMEKHILEALEPAESFSAGAATGAPLTVGQYS
jgi:glycosyltransferase involved in cell wall biosynthesis